jgi:enamine deaminase RidA (YjgF/YER057c/UK114 family)
MSKEIFSPATMPPPTGYSHVAKVTGTLVYVAGQVSNDASGKLVGEGNFEAQVEQVFKNVKLALEAAGATMNDIVKMNTYLVAEVSQDDLPKMRAIRDQGKAAGQHARCREPAGAAGLADRDRSRCGNRLVESFRGAREREPGISQTNLGIPGPRASARPGMTWQSFTPPWS